MIAACLLVAGVVAATVPGSDFELRWTHSVERTEWVERYRVEPEALRLVEASVAGSGAGVDPPPGATLERGRWRWRVDRTVPEVALRRSGFSADYAICTASGCTPLESLAGPAGPDAVVVLRPCGGR